MNRVLLVLMLLLGITGCSTALSDRLSVQPVAGQPRSRVILDQQECERVADRVPQFYAACMVSRGYVSEVSLVVIDQMGSTEYRPLPTGTMEMFLRADRPVTFETAQEDIVACEQVFHAAVRDTPTATKVARDLVSHWTFGAAHITESRYRKAFAECMAPRGYGVSDDRDELR